MNKTVLFDLDGTLVDSSEGIIKAVQYALKYFGIEENDTQKLGLFIGPPLRPSFINHYGFTKEAAEEAVIKYREYYRPIGLFECKLYPGVEQCIKTLRSKGYRIGLASSKPEQFCKTILAHLGLIDLFDDVVGATEDGVIGTKEEVLRELIRRSNDADIDNMCLVGDTIYDVEGANKVGIRTICVSFGFGNVDEMLNAGAAKICNSMDELPNVIEEVFF